MMDHYRDPLFEEDPLTADQRRRVEIILNEKQEEQYLDKSVAETLSSLSSELDKKSSNSNTHTGKLKITERMKPPAKLTKKKVINVRKIDSKNRISVISNKLNESKKLNRSRTGVDKLMPLPKELRKSRIRQRSDDLNIDSSERYLQEILNENELRLHDVRERSAMSVQHMQNMRGILMKLVSSLDHVTLDERDPNTYSDIELDYFKDFIKDASEQRNKETEEYVAVPIDYPALNESSKASDDPGDKNSSMSSYSMEQKLQNNSNSNPEESDNAETDFRVNDLEKLQEEVSSILSKYSSK